MTLRWKYILPIALAVAVIVVIGMAQPRKMNWRESFEGDEKIPFGCYVVRDLLPDLFPGANVRETDDRVSETLADEESPAPKNYIFVNGSIVLGGDDLDSLLRFVDRGGERVHRRVCVWCA
jgi:hypothetical protein